jgi:hypothetical protein
VIVLPLRFTEAGILTRQTDRFLKIDLRLILIFTNFENKVCSPSQITPPPFCEAKRDAGATLGFADLHGLVTTGKACFLSPYNNIMIPCGRKRFAPVPVNFAVRKTIEKSVGTSYSEKNRLSFLFYTGCIIVVK